MPHGSLLEKERREGAREGRRKEGKEEKDR